MVDAIPIVGSITASGVRFGMTDLFSVILAGSVGDDQPREKPE